MVSPVTWEANNVKHLFAAQSEEGKGAGEAL